MSPRTRKFAKMAQAQTTAKIHNLQNETKLAETKMDQNDTMISNTYSMVGFRYSQGSKDNDEEVPENHERTVNSSEENETNYSDVKECKVPPGFKLTAPLQKKILSMQFQVVLYAPHPVFLESMQSLLCLHSLQRKKILMKNSSIS